VSEEHEREGLDSSEHGIVTYPEFGENSVSTPGRAGSTTAADSGVADDD
jgi:Amt family ammonium transporter